MKINRQSSINFAVRAGELVVASLLAHYFRVLIDLFLVPLQLDEWALFAVRVFFLFMFVLVALQLHGLLINFLKRSGVLPQDFRW
ncbi:MAG: hypothetical protein LWX83_06250 [Anaerolineae bacterium]|nr:hypothetical protein [Anaerolineae bacterium]